MIDGYQNKLDNKYLKWYRNIVIKRLKEPKLDYHEKHHILPLSLGGSNDKENIVNLSAREHFVVHFLLTKFVTGQGKHKMDLAFHSLSFLKSKNRKETYFNSKLYEMHKLEISKANSIRSKIIWNDQEKRNRIIESQKESWKNGKRSKQLETMKTNSPLKNKEIHSKSIKNRSENGTNVWVTNNPMKDKNKALEIASKRSGDNHYSKIKIKYFYKLKDEETWQELEKGSLHKFRKENNLTRSELHKILNEEIAIKNVRMKKEYENQKNN
jgi:hypothetical protein